MARDGSGNYNLASGNPVVTNTLISSSVTNGTLADIATALTNSLAKNGETTPTANLPMGGNKHTGVADGSVRNQYSSVGQVQDGTMTQVGSVAMTSNAYTGSIVPAIVAYGANMLVSMIATTGLANTGASTLALNGLGVKAIVKGTGVPLIANDIVVGIPAFLLFISAATGWLLLNPQTVTIVDASLSSNVPLKNAANTFTAPQTLNATAATVTLSINGAPSQYSNSLLGDATTGGSFGLLITAGTNSSDFALNVRNHAGGAILQARGDGVVLVGGVALGTLATQSGTFSGTHSGTSSGTNSGDQTITLTGDATGSGAGSFAVAVPNYSGRTGHSRTIQNGGTASGGADGDVIDIY